MESSNRNRNAGNEDILFKDEVITLIGTLCRC